MWSGCEVTAVEFDTKIAEVYADLYPTDIIVVGDAHQYLIDHYDEFDFIWSSPPCQSHSRMRHHLGVGAKGFQKKYPDMRLYEEIVFLTHFCKVPWVVESVIPYYEPMFSPQRIDGRHLYWSNLKLTPVNNTRENLRAIQIPQLQQLHGINLSDYKLSDKRQVLRNCVSPAVGLSVYNDVLKCRKSNTPIN